MGLYSEFVFVDEAYFGKTGDVKKIEQAIHIARQPYLGKKIAQGISYNYNDKNIMKVGDAIQKAFNFPVVDFNVINDAVKNAFCYPVSSSIVSLASRSKLKITDKGELKCDNQNKLMCALIRITSGLWGDTKFSDAEITAIILHEIGHSVQHLANSHVARFSLINAIINLVASLGSGTTVIEILRNPVFASKIFNDIKKDFPTLSNIIGGVDSIKGIIKYILNTFTSLFSFIPFVSIANASISILTSMATSLANPIVFLTSIFSKGKEYNADSFAASFGYSEALTSALLKMELDNSRYTGTNTEEFINNIPVIGTINNFTMIPFMILLSPIMDHPITPKRINSMIVELENELKKSDLSSAMKKEIQQNIKDVKETVKNYTEPKNNKDTLKYNRKWLQKQINYKSKENKFVDMDMVEKEVYEAAIVTEYIRISALYESLLESEFDNEYEDDDIDILDWEC